MSESAFPLTWPRGWKRTPANQRDDRPPFAVGEERHETYRSYEAGQYVDKQRTRSTRKAVTVGIATERLEQQLELLGADHPVLSTNMELRLDGRPRADRRDPDDPGAAIWFTLKGKRMVFACDKWTRVADNIAALAAHIRAIRSVERYGVGTVEQAFRGYRALEDFSQGVPWRRVLGFKDEDAVTREVVEARYREHAKRVHPDLTGEHGIQMSQLNEAIAEARKELSA